MAYSSNQLFVMDGSTTGAPAGVGGRTKQLLHGRVSSELTVTVFVDNLFSAVRIVDRTTFCLSFFSVFLFCLSLSVFLFCLSLW